MGHDGSGKKNRSFPPYNSQCLNGYEEKRQKKNS